MKSTIMMLALAATVSLGACVGPYESNTPSRDYRHTTTQDQQNRYYRDNAAYYNLDGSNTQTRDYRHTTTQDQQNRYYRDNATYYNRDNPDYRNESYVFRGEDLSRDDVRKVQTSLAREGFYRGRIDGVWGRSTSQAILNYQTARYPGRTGMRVDTLQEFGVRMDQDYYNRQHYHQRNNR